MDKDNCCMERWNIGTKAIIFGLIILVTILVFFGSAYLCLGKGWFGLLIWIVVLGVYNELVLTKIINIIKKYRYKLVDVIILD